MLANDGIGMSRIEFRYMLESAVGGAVDGLRAEMVGGAGGPQGGNPDKARGSGADHSLSAFNNEQN